MWTTGSGFWIPITLMLPLGLAWVVGRHSKATKMAGSVLIGVSIGLALSTQWMVNDGGITVALSQVLLAILGPSMLLGCAVILLVFSTDSPVGPLPPGVRPLGVIALGAGLAWLLALALISPPGISGLLNPYWFVWLGGLLFSLLCISVIAFGFTISMGHARQKEILLLAPLPLVSIALLLRLSVAPSPGSTIPKARTALFESGLDVLGSVIGSLLTLAITVILIVYNERAIAVLPEAPPLTSQEIGHIESVIQGVQGEDE